MEDEEIVSDFVYSEEGEEEELEDIEVLRTIKQDPQLF